MALPKNLAFTERQTVLFVGCGTGIDLEYIPLHNLNITAIDFSIEEIVEK